jgi:hypothetical protein
MSIETVFYDKELSDIIRDVVVNSACTFDFAEVVLFGSKNIERDAEIVKKLSDCGVSKTTITTVIRAMNTD